MLLIGLLSRACSVCFLLYPRTTCPGVAPFSELVPPTSINSPALVWQTKLVSPLIRKAGFLAAWRHLCSNLPSREESGSHLHRLQPRSAKQGRHHCAPWRWWLCQLGKGKAAPPLSLSLSGWSKPVQHCGMLSVHPNTTPEVAHHSRKIGSNSPN